MVWSDPPKWSESFPAQNFSFAHEAAQYILKKTSGSVTDDALNAFVLSWGKAVGRALLNTQKQNRNRVGKYRRSWEKHGHCRDMNA
jgi:hypothetical protein